MIYKPCTSITNGLDREEKPKGVKVNGQRESDCVYKHIILDPISPSFLDYVIC